MAYTKLDHGITESTIWYEPDPIRLVWICMLSMVDKHGYVGASVPGLAGKARVSLQDCIHALDKFKSPDEFSRTKDHEGRRIADADGGWVLLNHAKYLAIQNEEDRRERARVAMATLRANRKQLLPIVSDSDDSLPQLAHVAVDVAVDLTEATTKKEQKHAQREKKPRATPAAQPLDPSELAGTLPLVDGTDYEVSKSLLAEIAPAYPGIDCKAELRKVKAWLIANPKNRKTRTGIIRFLNSWLAREQNRTGGDHVQPRPAKLHPAAQIRANYEAAKASGQSPDSGLGDDG